MSDARSSMFRKYYFKELESAVVDIDEKVEVIHGDRLRQLQSQRLRTLHKCMARNPDGDSLKNKQCQDAYEGSGLDWIQEKLETEKLALTICAQSAFSQFVGGDRLAWDNSKAQVDKCLSDFRQNIFMKCFSQDSQLSTANK